jgi:hypothetical protein
MAVYFITGKLGCGKTLCTVGKIRDYLEQGRRVATNLDINLTAFTKHDSMAYVTRVPDKPSLRDLEIIGEGCEESNEDKYGLLVLDELGTWFNSRNWRDKERLDTIDWFLHARKKHWDIFFIVQNINSLDDQLVSALCEHLVICKRTDRLSIPIIGPILKTIGFTKVLPKIHVAKVYYGQSVTSMPVDRWWYRGKDLYSAYNTDQIFDDESHSVHSVLPAYYRNNVALINHHQIKIKKLTPDLKIGQPPAGLSLKMGASVFFAFIFFLVSYRTYAKYQDFTKEPIVINQPKIVNQLAGVKAAPVVTYEERYIQEKDNIQKLTEGAEIIVTSFYVDNGNMDAILHVKKDSQESLITLDDVRSLGYMTSLQGHYLTVMKGIYTFTVKTPG